MWITCGQAVENYIFSVDKTFFYKILQNVKRLFYSRLILNSKNISLKAKLFKTFFTLIYQITFRQIDYTLYDLLLL